MHDFLKIKTTFHGLLNNTQQFGCHFLFIKLGTYLTAFLCRNSRVHMSVRIILGFWNKLHLKVPPFFKIKTSENKNKEHIDSNSYLIWSSLSNSCRHLANVNVIAKVKSRITVSHQHFFADVIFLPLEKFKTIKIKSEKNFYTQTNTYLLHISRNFKDIFKHICFTLSL